MNGLFKAYLYICGTVCAVRVVRSYGMAKKKEGYRAGLRAASSAGNGGREVDEEDRRNITITFD